MKIQIILGSTRPSRVSEGVGKWIEGELKKREQDKKEGIEIELLDLRDWPLPFYNEPASSASLNGKYSTEIATNWVKKIGEGDAYIIIAPEYNHSFPAVLKNALDYPYYEWNRKPVGFVSYGGVAGARSVEQLRLVTIELQMAPLRHAVYIKDVWSAFDEQNHPKDPKLNETAAGFFDQLMWWANALKNARDIDKK